MPKPTLDNILSISDPMLSDNFELIFGNVPSISGTGNTEALRLQCKTASKPGMSMEQVSYDLFGHTVKFAGKLTFSHTMSINYVETWKGDATRTLENWLEVGRGVQSGHGKFKAEYASPATLIIYNQMGEISLQYKIVNMWPTEVPEVEFDGSSAEPVTLAATFSFDYYTIGS